jgi:hypothetical protein
VNIDWVPDFMQVKMEAFIHNRIVAQVGSVVSKAVKDKVSPRLEVVLESVGKQMVLLDQDIKKTIEDIRNDIRRDVGHLPPISTNLPEPQLTVPIN